MELTKASSSLTMLVPTLPYGVEVKGHLSRKKCRLRLSSSRLIIPSPPRFNNIQLLWHKTNKQGLCYNCSPLVRRSGAVTAQFFSLCCSLCTLKAIIKCHKHPINSIVLDNPCSGYEVPTLLLVDTADCYVTK